MDYSAANTALWGPIIQIAIIAGAILLANVLRRKIPFFRKALIPTAVLGGFLVLIGKSLGILPVNLEFFETITYHFIAIGFIAMSLRVPERTDEEKGNLIGLKSGAVIVSTYMIQAIAGLAISLLLAYTIKPGFFKASGILLALGYGQGPGQANNIGGSYEALGFTGGRAFGLAIAAAGYLSACIVGVLYMTYLSKKGKFVRKDQELISGSVTVDTFQHKNEIPIAESLDRFSMQACLVLGIYGLTYLVIWGLTSLLTAISPGLGNTLNPMLWGFNFIVGSAMAIAVRVIFKQLRKFKLMNRQYQNNYLLSRLSGLAFDIMIVAGIGSIEISDLEGLWLPFILMAVTGAVLTLIHLKAVCKRVYPGYFYEGMLSMYGMLTGTISSGVLLLRELDPQMETPAANNLVLGSSFAIMLGAPLLVLVGMAPNSTAMTFTVLGLVIVYYLLLLGIIRIKRKKK